VEERRTVVDDKGEQTTVTRTVDGQTVRETRIKNKNGEQETIEDLINMDESMFTALLLLLFEIFFILSWLTLLSE